MITKEQIEQMAREAGFRPMRPEHDQWCITADQLAAYTARVIDLAIEEARQRTGIFEREYSASAAYRARICREIISALKSTGTEDSDE